MPLCTVSGAFLTRACVGGWGERERERERWGERVTSYIWHSMDVHAEWPHFSVLPTI